MINMTVRHVMISMTVRHVMISVTVRHVMISRHVHITKMFEIFVISNPERVFKASSYGHYLPPVTMPRLICVGV